MRSISFGLYDELLRYQAEVWGWARSNFGDVDQRGGDVVSATLGLAEEAGELCRAVLKQHQQIRGTHAEWQAEIEKELGDVMIKCFDVAARAGIDMAEALDERWGSISQRTPASQQGTRLPETS